MQPSSVASGVDSPARRRGRWNPEWIRACLVGELLGFVPPAVTGAMLVALGAPEIVLVVGLVAAGAVEGLILGRTQNTVLQRLIPGVTGWPSTTAFAAGLAWLAGMGGSSLVGAVGAKGLIIAVPGWIIGLFAMGVLQARRLRPVVPDAWSWVPATTVAWLVGVSIPVAALSIVPNNWPPAVHVVVAIPAAVAMGATVGAITGRTLNRLAA